MILRSLLIAASAFASVPAVAQTDPATSSPAAADAPKPYTPPSGNAPQANAPAAGTTAVAIPPADPAAQQAADGLPTQIEDVQVVGPWTEGDASGVWRTVMMQVGGNGKDTYRFFIQKLDRVGMGAKILASTEIKEIAGVDGSVVGYRADEPEDGKANDLTLFFDIVPSTGEIPETYELHFLKDQPYTFGPASN